MNVMKIYNLIIYILVIILIIVFCCFASEAGVERIDNKIKIELVSCIDGDTAKFVIDGKEEKVRFLGIDTPESTNYVETYGKEASEHTCSLLEDANNIYLEYDSNSDKRDKYDRVLAWIFVDNNNLSELLLLSGYAEVKYIYGDYKYIDELCNAQGYAYKNNLGIWSIDYNYKKNYCNKNK